MASALVTLLLAAAGLFGVTSYSVTARTCEIGVRITLGAAPARVVRMLMAQGVRPVILGIGIGLVAALWAGRLIERFLFDVQAFDPFHLCGGRVLGFDADAHRVSAACRASGACEPHCGASTGMKV